ncbi:MAG: SAM-dependent methyltransferase [Armatimonadetes bacterium]|nr:SAM-dependent methyltransferase [Armatimonadota bacterium]
MTEAVRSASSFRDPSGFVFQRDGVLYRQINQSAAADFELLVSSGLQNELTDAGLVVAVEEADLSLAVTPEAAKVIRPARIPFVSYPYEWSFSQLKDAALLTLEVMRRALGKGMSLKDASAYNVQFVGTRPVLIDTLSFEPYVEGEPWVAYKQFCQHFLAPLALMSHVDIRLGSLLQTNIDGIPLDLASNLLPGKTKFQPGLLTHIHLHAKAQSHDGGGKTSDRKPTISKTSLLALVDNLKGTVSGLTWKPAGTEWADYYANTNYSKESLSRKAELVASFLAKVPGDAQTCWDLGANNGEFSRLAAARSLYTIAWDIDPAAVEQAYLACKSSKADHLLPLLQDLRNPSTDLGWAGAERDSLQSRGPADVVLALALVHHLAIGNNVPLDRLADFFAQVGRWLIVEFVPKEDSQVQRMLVARKYIFTSYDLSGFEQAFQRRFETVEKQEIEGTCRTLFLMRRI